MVLALVGDSTMTRSGLPARERTGASARISAPMPLPLAAAAAGRRLRGGPVLAAALFLRAAAPGASSSVGCFLRAGTSASLVAVVLRAELATITTLSELR